MTTEQTEPAGRDTSAETLGRINYEAGLAKAREQGSNTLFDEWAHLEDWDRERCEAGAVAVAAHVANPEAKGYDKAADFIRLRNVVCNLLDLFGAPDDRLMQQARVTRATLQRYAAEAGVRLDGLDK